MTTDTEKKPNPKELEKEISKFLSKRFGDNVKIISPIVEAQPLATDVPPQTIDHKAGARFDLKPQELIDYLDQYIVRQDAAKQVLATKICTHFNRIQHCQDHPDQCANMVGGIKSNILMMGPTGVGKTYMIRLIANKIGVPFVKGDATKFSETGYVGGDVEDLVRDLVREADNDLDMAQYGIIYIDEVDKIASSHHLIGADVSRTGVQRALLKPMEETEVELKVPHDPISMIQEIEQFRKTGSRDQRTINTRNILFIMSGAFSGLADLIRKRLSDNTIGFSAPIATDRQDGDYLAKVRTEDLIQFGFESEFVGRLPVRTVFELLSESDLFEILKNPNNPIILGKKLDFAAYGIRISFQEAALRRLAQQAYGENTGARGLVSTVEKALMPFETRLPSMPVGHLAVTEKIIAQPDAILEQLDTEKGRKDQKLEFDHLITKEKQRVKNYLEKSAIRLAEKHNLTLTPSRIDITAQYYLAHTTEIDQALQKIKTFYDDTKKLELGFFKRHDINIVLEEDAIDHIIGQVVSARLQFDAISEQLDKDFELGLKLVRDKTGRNRFFLNREALLKPVHFIENLIKRELNVLPDKTSP